MTNEDFGTFMDRLFVAFPSLYEWMQGTYKPEETQRVWRAALQPYSLEECLSVVSAWSSGKLPSPAAYDRDKVHLMVRAVVSKNRDMQARKNANRDIVELPKRTALDVPGVAEAFKRGYEIKKAVMDGSLAESEARAAIAKIVDEVA